MDFLDEIVLTGLTVFGHHGVYPHERENGQEFTVDLRLRLSSNRPPPPTTWPTRSTTASSRVAAVVPGEPVNLIETLAERIADVALGDRRVQQVTVTVHKPQAPIALTFGDVAVTVHRTRAPESLEDITT